MANWAYYFCGFNSGSYILYQLKGRIMETTEEIEIETWCPKCKKFFWISFYEKGQNPVITFCPYCGIGQSFSFKVERDMIFRSNPKLLDKECG